jgi:hypothetical protein
MYGESIVSLSTPNAGEGSSGGSSSSSSSMQAESSVGGCNGYTLVAKSLARCGVTLMFGVIGIPVTELASAVQVMTHFRIILP